jgi:hypothetical protein
VVAVEMAVAGGIKDVVMVDMSAAHLDALV